MTDVQLQQKLSNSNVATIWIYQSTNNNGVVLYILNYNGHELARKEYNTRSGGWDDTTDPKMWFYPLPNNANDIDVHPIGDFSFLSLCMTFDNYSSVQVIFYRWLRSVA